MFTHPMTICSRSTLTIALAAGALALALLVGEGVSVAANPSADSSAAPVIAAVGDIACQSSAPITTTTCRHAAVARAIEKSDPDSVWLLGDIQYPNGALDDFRSSFGKSFASLKSLWRPAPGNHEYYTPGAAGYYDFFGSAAGPAGRGYYSFNLRNWHVVSLNSNCDVIDCSENSPQLKWLRSDLKKNRNRCTAAFWHHPLYSSGLVHGDDPRSRPLWQVMQKNRAEFVLTGHDHDFEAFGRQDAFGRRDAKRGLMQFVVGTGGKSAYGLGQVSSNSRVRITDSFGFLSMQLNRNSFDWRYVQVDGKVRARGSGRCS
ncbi:MAG: metallophosphoesterase [Thermoleophilaceae bacterium]|nr:metallophosphoesterase [Thermoleophilaceae bacterium]